jgi:hypothetical protein
MHLLRAQPCTSAAHSRAAASVPPRSLTHARSLSRSACRLARIPPRAGLASHHLPEGFCILCIASAPTTAPCPGRYLALTTGATPTASAPPLQHDARRPHDQGFRHPPLAPDEGDSHLQHRRDRTRQALPQEEARADQDQPHPSAQVARRLLRAGLRWRHRSTYPVRGRRGPSSRARGLEACLEVERRGLEDVMRHEVRGRGRAPRTR